MVLSKPNCRQICGICPDVAEEIRQVADRHRRAELARDAVAAHEVAHERFAAHEKLVRHHVPRADQDAPASIAARSRGFCSGPDLE
jgi:hypothetical protein